MAMAYLQPGRMSSGQEHSTRAWLMQAAGQSTCMWILNLQSSCVCICVHWSTTLVSWAAPACAPAHHLHGLVPLPLPAVAAKLQRLETADIRCLFLSHESSYIFFQAHTAFAEAVPSWVDYFTILIFFFKKMDSQK